MKIGALNFDRPRRRISPRSEKGLALAVVMICVLLLTILGFSVLMIANDEVVLAQNYVNKTKAFYLAEAGVEVLTVNLNKGIYGNIDDTAWAKAVIVPMLTPPQTLLLLLQPGRWQDRRRE